MCSSNFLSDLQLCKRVIHDALFWCLQRGLDVLLVIFISQGGAPSTGDLKWAYNQPDLAPKT